MFEILLNQNVCMYVMIVCGCIGLTGRAVMSSYLARLAKAAERMGTTRKKQLMEMRRRYEDITSLDVNIHDTAAFVDKYIDRLKIGFIPINVWNGFVKNMGVAAAGTGIFAAAYQYYVVGDGVSVPCYDPENLADSLQAENSPFLNRALQSYAVGSVFKPVLADRKSTRLNSSHWNKSRMPSSA